MVYGVILAGGKGERFWPISRAKKPKQFLKLTSDKMMLEETIDRVLPYIPLSNIRIVVGQTMREMVIDNIKDVSEQNILTEPRGRNTCAAIGLAATHLYKNDEDAVLVVLSADHIIKPKERLLEILKTGATIALSDDRLITIGIVPTRPETGYGYIKLGEKYKQEADHIIYKVAAFTEKPKAAIAYEYYYSHNYLWNSGMFIWSAKTILNAIKECQPDLSKLLGEYSKHIGTKKEMDARKELYEKVIPISIDFAVLEKAANVLTIKADIIWDDIGGWNSLARYKKVDSENNVISGDAVVIDSYESIIYNNSDGIIACLGISDLVIVRNGNVTLIVHKTKADQIKEIISNIEENKQYDKYL